MNVYLTAFFMREASYHTDCALLVDKLSVFVHLCMYGCNFLLRHEKTFYMSNVF
jgi:hypothetical protein